MPERPGNGTGHICASYREGMVEYDKNRCIFGISGSGKNHSDQKAVKGSTGRQQDGADRE